MKFTFPPESKPLDGYTIKRAIHRGGFGEVYYAQSDAGKEVALKLLQQNLEIELRGVTQCLNLKHPNLVTIFDIRCDSDGDHWIVMEYVHGKCMDEVLAEANGPLPMEEVQSWLAGIVAGLSFLHDRGIVHRDLKPANVFRENGVVKIGDVGLAKFITQSRRSAQTESVGTVYYMAPEVARGRYGHEVDIYSLGVVLYEMLTGRLPFDGESTAEILMKHLSERPDLTPIPKRLRPVLAQVLEKEPLKRTPGAQRLLDDFRKAVLGIDIPTTIPEESFLTVAPNGFVEITTGNGSVANRTDKRRGEPFDERRNELFDEDSGSAAPLPPTGSRSRNFAATTATDWKKTAAKKSKPSRKSLKIGVIVLLFLAIFAPATLSSLVNVAVKLAVLSGLGFFIYRSVTKNKNSATKNKNSGAAPTNEETLRTSKISQSPPGLGMPDTTVPPVPRKPKLRWIHASALSPETPRSLPMRDRVTELSGSLSFAVLCSGLITAVFALLSDVLSSPGRIALFGVTSVAAAWMLMTTSKIYEGTRVGSRQRRIVHLFGGLFIGSLTFFLQHLLLIQFTNTDANPQGLALFQSIGSLKLIQGTQPTLFGYAVFFAGLFSLRRWWRHSDSLRKQRLSVGSVLLTTLLAMVWSQLISFPLMWGVGWAAAISCVVHLSAAWIPPEERHRLRETATDG